MSVPGEEERLVRVHDVIQQLPPPHYRTLEYLLRHLARMARHSANTSMHARNLAIVWAPNLLRSMELESVGMGGAAAFREVRVQSVVVEFLLTHVDVLFSDTFTSAGLDPAGMLSHPEDLATAPHGQGCRGGQTPHPAPDPPRLPALPRTPAQSGLSTSEGPLARGRCLLPRPKSLAGSCPSTRLLTLEEAQARTQGRLGTPTEPTTPKAPASPVER
ncbi:Rho GTPase-activating protein 33 [Saguinus oedipus]|uniref:Rho GTPase-activating protein 33 n=1 Tax=Saguinus oedipus TaxID=9490 RepID=A0ABQ9TUR4_SAGOE|nr:Rho GTPase-activating protein 33 [Saguinus oedipus]